MTAEETRGPILFVDDEQDIRDVVEIALMDAGYDVFLAEDGRQAMQVFQKEHPPIVITDIKMPVMDGIELLQRIKQLRPDTEVIMITGHGDMNLAIRSIKSDATDFITKPINVDALEIALRRVHEKIFLREKLASYTTHLEQLLKEKTELQDHLSSLGLMIGSISHGIKGLLTGLDGGMYLLEGGFKKQKSEQIKEGMDIVKLMVERIRRMVMDILFYAKKRELQWETVDVSRFSEEIGRMVAAKIKDPRITFECHVQDTVGQISIDPGYIHAALMTIIDNAIDACSQDTTQSHHTIDFTISETEQDVIFSISDTGVGMDEQTLSKLFTAFFSSKDRGGTGLGLFITHNIVEQHGGHIKVTSKLGKGSTFTVKLPKAFQPSDDASVHK